MLVKRRLVGIGNDGEVVAWEAGEGVCGADLESTR